MVGDRVDSNYYSLPGTLGHYFKLVRSQKLNFNRYCSDYSTEARKRRGRRIDLL